MRLDKRIGRGFADTDSYRRYAENAVSELLSKQVEGMTYNGVQQSKRLDFFRRLKGGDGGSARTDKESREKTKTARRRNLAEEIIIEEE